MPLVNSQFVPFAEAPLYSSRSSTVRPQYWAITLSQVSFYGIVCQQRHATTSTRRRVKGTFTYRFSLVETLTVGHHASRHRRWCDVVAVRWWTCVNPRWIVLRSCCCHGPRARLNSNRDANIIIHEKIRTIWAKGRVVAQPSVFVSEIVVSNVYASSQVCH